MPDFYEMLQQAGWDEYQAPGALWLPELEIMYALSCLRRARWDDHDKARLRRHLIIMGPTGASKTTAAEKFLTDFVGARDFTETPAEQRHDAPTYFEFQAGTSWERIRGGMDENGLQIPIAKATDVLLCGELMDFLGHTTSSRRNKIDSLNTFLETGKMTVALVKARRASLSGEDRKQIEKYGIMYIEDMGTLSYRVVIPFVACTRFFSDDELQDVASSGLLSRLSIASWNPSPAEYIEWWNIADGGWNDVSKHRDHIQRVNKRMRELNWKIVPFPRKFMSDAMAYLDQLYAEVETQKSLHPAVLRSRRDVGFVAQCITGAAVMRTASELLDSDVEHVGRLEYTIDDLDMAKKFISQRVMSLQNLLDINNLEKTGISAKATKFGEEQIGNYLKLLDAFILGKDGILLRGQSFHRVDLVRAIMDMEDRSQAQAYRITDKMREAGLVTRPTMRELRISEQLWNDRYAHHDPDWVQAQKEAKLEDDEDE